MAVFSRLFIAVALTTQGWLPFASAVPSVNSTCAPGSDGFQFVIGKVSQQAVFKCGSNAKLNPETSDDVTQVCTKDDCSQTGDLSQLVPNSKITKGSDDYTFSLTKLPDTEQTFFLQCVSTSAGGPGSRLQSSTPACLVKFTVKTKPAGIPECASKETNVDLKVDTAGKNVQFRCGDSFPTLDPKTVTEVYKDSSCSESVALTSIASGATLSTSSETDVHTLTVPNLPSSQQQVCYRCLSVVTDRSVQEACKVLITLSPATVVTTPKPSSAVQAAASVLLFLSLSFAGLLHVF